MVLQAILGSIKSTEVWEQADLLDECTCREQCGVDDAQLNVVKIFALIVGTLGLENNVLNGNEE